MKKALSPYVVLFQGEPFHKGKRYHWMICRAQNPEELVSWGHEPTRELAEGAAQREVKHLSTGLIQGGMATGKMKPLRRRIANGNH